MYFCHFSSNSVFVAQLHFKKGRCWILLTFAVLLTVTFYHVGKRSYECLIKKMNVPCGWERQEALSKRLKMLRRKEQMKLDLFKYLQESGADFPTIFSLN